MTPSGVSALNRTSGPVPPLSDRARMPTFVLPPGAMVAVVGPTPIWYGCSPARKEGGASDGSLPHSLSGVPESV